jgi:peptidoglycan/xylan/chitin deacetylase (PgdA/CDA1 family)
MEKSFLLDPWGRIVAFAMYPVGAPLARTAREAFSGMTVVLSLAGPLCSSCGSSHSDAYDRAGHRGGIAPGVPASDLRAPGPGGVARPSGRPGSLEVLDWAGFRAAVTYTFDDSLDSQIENYRRLDGAGVRLTFFITCDHNGKDPVWSQAIEDGHEVANHTMHHCHSDGSHCAWGQYSGSLLTEISACSELIVNELGAKGVYTMAAPFGDGGYAGPAMSTLFLNRGVQTGQVLPFDESDPFSLPCYAADQGELAKNLDGPVSRARSEGAWQVFLIHSLGDDGGYHPMSMDELMTNIHRTQAFEDVWIDSMLHVGAYWLGQKAVARATKDVAEDEETWTWTLPANFPPHQFVRVNVSGGRLSQGGRELLWDEHGYYEVALDLKTLTISP